MIQRLARFVTIEHLVYGAWVIALLSTLGSWGLSEIMHLTPCIMCWIQRIFMYPLAVIIPVGILRRDPDLPFYVLPLSIGGGLVAFYHTLLQWGIIPEAIAPCVNGVSCAVKQLDFFGFVTIPFMSLLAFVALTALMLLALRREFARQPIASANNRPE